MSLCFFSLIGHLIFLQNYTKKIIIPYYICKKVFIPGRKIGIEGRCWHKDKHSMPSDGSFRRSKIRVQLLKTTIYLQFSDISRIFAPNI